MGVIKVNYAAMQGAEGDIRATAEAVRGQLEDLRASTEPLIGDWTGPAAEQYQVQRARMEAAWNDLNGVLGEIAVLVARNSENFGMTDNKVKQMWA